MKLLLIVAVLIVCVIATLMGLSLPTHASAAGEKASPPLRQTDRVTCFILGITFR
jgi:hypothetical protein